MGSNESLRGSPLSFPVTEKTGLAVYRGAVWGRMGDQRKPSLRSRPVVISLPRTRVGLALWDGSTAHIVRNTVCALMIIAPGAHRSLMILPSLVDCIREN